MKIRLTHGKTFIWILLWGLGSSLSSQRSVELAIRELEQKEKALIEERKKILDSVETLRLEDIQERLNEMGFPGPGDVIRHPGFALTYHEEHEQAIWVAHIILPQIREGREGRTNIFMEDPKIPTGSAQEIDYFTKTMKPDSSGYKYRGFGFDRGHIAASADFRWSKKALAATYYYSNMSPQRADLNRGRWAELEGLMRELVEKYDTMLYVVAGPVLYDTLPKIPQSPNRVSIPYHYYKVAYNPATRDAIGFIMPNAECPNPVTWYAVSVDSVEALTGLRFFPALADTHARRVKSRVDISGWLPTRQEGEVLPLDPKALPRGAVNTRQLTSFNLKDSPKAMVCGTVVSATRSKKDNVFLNFDSKFPNTVFSVSIWSSNLTNFTYAPEVFLMDKEICVSGRLGEWQGKPNMNISTEENIKLLDDEPQ
jgi:endonuclease G, mitochondrial